MTKTLTPEEVWVIFWWLLAIASAGGVWNVALWHAMEFDNDE